MILKKDFYFIRHGQTDFNVKAIMNRENESLNATGKQQAQQAEKIIATLPIKTICFSSLNRVKETKEIISSQLNATHYEVPKLGEVTKFIWDDLTKAGPSALESPLPHLQEFFEGIRNGLTEALTKDEPVLIVAHRSTHWAICCLLDIQEHEWVIDNCIPVHFSVDAAGKWKAQKLQPLFL
ncbi:MAG: histidine phosphatase family protein [Chlamydiia bacterium]